MDQKDNSSVVRPKRPLPASGPPTTTERSNGRGAHLAVPTFGSLMEYGANRRPTKNNGRKETDTERKRISLTDQAW